MSDRIDLDIEIKNCEPGCVNPSQDDNINRNFDKALFCWESFTNPPETLMEFEYGHGVISLCRCGFDEKLRCDPQACEPQPMMKRMLAIRR